MGDWIETGLGCFLLIVLLAVVAFIVSCSVDYWVYDRPSFRAQVACQERRMEPKRRNFDTAVVCVPINTRQDTTTVQVKTP